MIIYNGNHLLDSCGLQADPVLIPNWFSVLREDTLKDCENFPDSATQIHDEYLKKIEEDSLNQMWDNVKAEKDSIEIKIVKNSPRLTGVKYPKYCHGCSAELPQSGK